MKKAFFYCSVTLLCGGLIFVGCKKSDTIADDASTQIENADDDARVQLESNAAADDANAALSSDVYINGGRLAATTANSRHLPNVVVGADSILFDSVTKTVIIYYDGTTVLNNRTRTGSLSIQLTSGANWAAKGAVLTLTFNNFLSTRISDGKTIVIKGYKTITNLTGGLVSNLGTAGYQYDSVSHQISAPRDAGLGVIFDNGAIKTWCTDRTRTIGFVKDTTIGAITVRLYKYTLIGNYSTVAHTNISWWGNNRNDQTFYDVITAPIVCDQSIDWLVPISGQIEIIDIAAWLYITYGVNASGAPVAVGAKPYGYELSWIDLADNPRTIVVSY